MHPRIKILEITEISILEFYGNIRNIGKFFLKKYIDKIKIYGNIIKKF